MSASPSFQGSHCKAVLSLFAEEADALDFWAFLLAVCVPATARSIAGNGTPFGDRVQKEINRVQTDEGREPS